jgi:hypothetical protein
MGGHILPVIGDLAEIGVTMLQPIQPGLHQGRPEDVTREVQACVKHLAAGGGYVMASARRFYLAC